MPMEKHLVSVILPVHNQAPHIAAILSDYAGALKKLPVPYEVIPVVNGSRDASFAVCRGLAREMPFLRPFEIGAAGWGRAVRFGLARAGGETLCYTNCARTSAEDLLLLLFYALGNPGTAVKATRKVRDSWARRAGSLVFNLECKLLFGLPTWDVNATPKIFPRTFSALTGLARDDDLIDLEFNILCKRKRYPLSEVPVFSARRQGGRSTTRFSSALRMLRGALQMRLNGLQGAR